MICQIDPNMVIELSQRLNNLQMIETVMGTVPWWLGITSFSIAILILVLLMVPLIRRENRVLLRLGWRHSMSSHGEALGRVLPVSLLVAVFLASLSVGDGLYSMVEENTNRNLSEVDLVLEAPGFVDRDLITNDLEDVRTSAPIILLNGAARSELTTSSKIRMIGFDDDLLDLGRLELRDGTKVKEPPAGLNILINSRASRDLSLKVGDWVLVNLDPHMKSEDILLGMTDTGSIRINLTVSGIVKDGGLGRYREDALDKVLPTCFMELGRLGEMLGEPGVNRFLLDMRDGYSEEGLRNSIENGLTFQDVGFNVIGAEDAGGSLLISDQFLFDSGNLDPNNRTIQTLSYFVDSIHTDTGNLSYSVVSGIEDLSLPGGGPLRIGEAVVNNWTADEIGLKVGDTIDLDYRTADPSGRLSASTTTFKIIGIVNISGLFAESNLLPPIEGITDELSCSSWDPGFHVDIGSIEDEDLHYWEIYRTTPKIFISLEDARDMWSSQWGDTTALWISKDVDATLKAVEEGLTLETVEVSMIPVRENALSSSRAVSIFPGMFLTFGTALMASTGLVLFAITKELSLKRAGEWGVLRSLGTGRKKVILFGIYENLRPLIWGSLFGVLLGFIISFFLNLTLSTIWSDTVEGSEVPLTISIPTVLISISAGILISTIIIVAVVIREVLKVPVSNTRGEEPGLKGRANRWIPLSIGAVMLLGGLLILLLTTKGGGTFDVAGPYVIGSMLSGSGSALIMISLLPTTIDRTDLTLMVTASLSRRPGQTRLGIAFLALVLTVALSLSGMGTLLVSGLEKEKDSYGGGFDMVLETSLGIQGSDINIPKMEIVPVLTYGKEGGTCSNINAVYPPRLVGLPEKVRKENDFDLKAKKDGSSNEDIWNELGSNERIRIPILVDENTLKWIYFGDVGSIFELEPVPGKVVELEVIGILGPSILTGTFVMSEEALKALYPSSSSLDLMLVKGEPSKENILKLNDAFSDYGPEVRTVSDLARENLDYEMSYLSLFRDFLIFGVMVAMAALVMFNHNRTLRFRKEMVVYRSLGVADSRARSYLLIEDLAVLLISITGAIIGAFISISITGSIISGSTAWGDIIKGSAPVLLLLMAVSVISSVISSRYSVRDYEHQVPRGDA